MSLTNDIFASYRRPAKVLRRRIDTAPGEAAGLMVLMLACFLIFISQWPYLSLQAELDPSIPLNARLATTLFAWVFIMPLVAYAIAAISYLILRAFKAPATAFEARMALFWALLAAVPLWLFWGMLRGIVGEQPSVDIVGFLTFAAFLIFWSVGLREICRPNGASEAS